MILAVAEENQHPSSGLKRNAESPEGLTNFEGFSVEHKQINDPLLVSADIVEVTATGVPLRHQIFSNITLTVLTWFVLLGYAGLWIWYWRTKDPQHTHSHQLITNLANYGMILKPVSSVIIVVYRIHKVIIPLLLLMAPRKDIALRTITMIVINDTVQEFIRLFILEGRPFYDMSTVSTLKECFCSFGMPSGHLQGSTMLCCIVVYEICLHRRISKKQGFLIMSVFATIILCMMFGRLYLTKHSLPQLVLGMWQTFVIFLLGLYFEDTLNNICRKFLNRNSRVVFWFLSTAILLATLATVLWYRLYEKLIIQNKASHVRCHECWENSSIRFREIMGTNLMFVWTLPGLLLGLLLAEVSWKSCNYGLIKQHLGITGFLRILIALICFSPRGLHILVHLSLDNAILFSISTNLLAGVLLGYAPFKLFELLDLQLLGDITTKSSLK